MEQGQRSVHDLVWFKQIALSSSVCVCVYRSTIIQCPHTTSVTPRCALPVFVPLALLSSCSVQGFDSECEESICKQMSKVKIKTFCAKSQRTLDSYLKQKAFG